MKTISYFKSKEINSWIFKILVLALISLFSNHLTDIDNFPLSDSYEFPIISILESFFIGLFLLFLIEINFQFFEKRYFKQNITTKNLIFFIISSFGIISLIYIPLFFILLWIFKEPFSFYDLFVGIILTLLISFVFIILFYSKKIHRLFFTEKEVEKKLFIKKAGTEHSVNISEVAYFFSENKIVYLIQKDQQKIATDFTLQEVENLLNETFFIRANRQSYIHFNAVKESKPIENGKLLLRLEPSFYKNQKTEIIISRYKKKEFKDWLENLRNKKT